MTTRKRLMDIGSAMNHPPGRTGGNIGAREYVFGSDCRVLSEQQKRELWKKQGKCTGCGLVKTHERGTGVMFLARIPLTKEGVVYKGYCLRCHTLNEARIALGEAPIEEKRKPESRNKRRERRRRSTGRERRTSAVDNVERILESAAHAAAAFVPEAEEREVVRRDGEHEMKKHAHCSPLKSAHEVPGRHSVLDTEDVRRRLRSSHPRKDRAAAFIHDGDGHSPDDEEIHHDGSKSERRRSTTKSTVPAGESKPSSVSNSENVRRRLRSSQMRPATALFGGETDNHSPGTDSETREQKHLESTRHLQRKKQAPSSPNAGPRLHSSQIRKERRAIAEFVAEGEGIVPLIEGENKLNDYELSHSNPGQTAPRKSILKSRENTRHRLHSSQMQTEHAAGILLDEAKFSHSPGHENNVTFEKRCEQGRRKSPQRVPGKSCVNSDNTGHRLRSSQGRTDLTAAFLRDRGEEKKSNGERCIILKETEHSPSKTVRRVRRASMSEYEDNARRVLHSVATRTEHVTSPIISDKDFHPSHSDNGIDVKSSAHCKTLYDSLSTSIPIPTMSQASEPVKEDIAKFEIAEEASREDFRALMEKLRNNSSLPAVVKATCSQLREAAPSIRDRILASSKSVGGVSWDSAAHAYICPEWVKILVCAIDQNINDASVHGEVLFTLWTLATISPRFAWDVINCGGVESILMAMERHGNVSSLLRYGCGALTRLTENERHCIKVCAAKGNLFGKLVQVVNGLDERAMEWALRTLFDLSINTPADRKSIGVQIKDAVVGGRGVAVVIDSMQKNGRSNAAVSEWSLRLIWSLSAPRPDGDSGVVIVPSIDTINAVIRTMGQHGQFATVQEAACGLLSNLTISFSQVNRNSSAIVAQSIVEAVINSMRAHPASLAVLMSGCHALSNVCACAEDIDVRTMVAQLGGIEIISSAMNRFPDVASLQGSACLTIANICVGAGWIKDAVARSGCIESIVSAFRTHVMEQGSATLPSRDVASVGDGACTAIATLAVSTHNMKLLTSTGIMDDINQVFNHINPAMIPPSVQAASTNLLVGSLYSGNTTAGHVVFASALLDAMRSRTDVEEIGEASILLHLLSAKSKEYVDAAVLADDEGGGGLAHILHVMKSFPESAIIQENCCGLLSNIYAHIRHNRDVKDSTKTTRTLCIRTAEEIQAIIRSMRHHRLQEGVQYRACMSIRNFCAGSSFRVAKDETVSLALMEVVGDVNEAMMIHPRSTRVQRCACGVLWALAVASKGICVTIGSSDSVDCLLDAVCEFSEDESLQDDAFGALWALSSLPENNTELGTPDGIEVIIGALQKNSGHEDVVVKGCNILACLSSDSYQVKITMLDNEDMIHSIIDCMFLYPRSSSIQKAACATLANLAIDNCIKEDIAKQGGVDRLVAALRELSGDVQVVEKACEAICSLIPGVPDEILDGNDIILRVIESMQRHPDSVGVQADGIGTIRNLSVKKKLNKHQITRRRGLQAVVNAMREQISFERIQEKGCSCLLNLVVSQEDQREAGEAGVIQAILNAMMAHMENISLQGEALSSLSSLASHPPNKTIMNENDAINAIVWCMLVHWQSADIQAAACSTLATISIDVPTNQVIPMPQEEVQAVAGAMSQFAYSAPVQGWACLLLEKNALLSCNRHALQSCPQLPKLLRLAATNFPDTCGGRANLVLERIAAFI